jgi:peptide deformylase
MAILEILQIGDPRLKSKNVDLKPADTKLIKKIVADMVDTMGKDKIVGLAAPQIGENFKLFITEPRETPYRAADQSDILRVFINPKIIEFSKRKTTIYEGCGSVAANFFGPVIRPAEIVVEAYDIDFKKFQLRCDGMLARVIQHEYDHLSGIEFVEKISDYKKIMNFEFYNKNIRTSPTQASASKISVIEFTQL